MCKNKWAETLKISNENIPELTKEEKELWLSPPIVIYLGVLLPPTKSDNGAQK